MQWRRAICLRLDELILQPPLIKDVTFVFGNDEEDPCAGEKLQPIA